MRASPLDLFGQPATGFFEQPAKFFERAIARKQLSTRMRFSRLIFAAGHRGSIKLAYTLMTPRLRKFALTAHVTFSVGWLGAVAAYLAPALAGLTSQDLQIVRSAYVTMDLIGRFIIVPCSLAALLTGLVQSLGTEWGLFRHYWILLKLLLTIAAVIVLLVHLPTMSRVAEMTLSGADPGALRVHLLVHGAGGLLVLLTVAVLSIYKPWGGIRYQAAQRS